MIDNRSKFSAAMIVLAAGTLWGIFEATVGCLLHMLPLNMGWAIWYPVACFFIAAAYKLSKNTLCILLVAALSAFVKLIDLFLPIRIDKVINPSVSILFEAAAFYLGVIILNKISQARRKKFHVKMIFALGINICWRAMFSLYLLLLAPKWIRDVSVLSDPQKLMSFWIKENLITSLLIFAVFFIAEYIDINAIKERLLFVFKYKKACIAVVSILACADIVLQLYL